MADAISGELGEEDCWALAGQPHAFTSQVRLVRISGVDGKAGQVIPAPRTALLEHLVAQCEEALEPQHSMQNLRSEPDGCVTAASQVSL